MKFQAILLTALTSSAVMAHGTITHPPPVVARQDTVIAPPGFETRQVRPNTGANPSDSPRGPGLRRQVRPNTGANPSDSPRGPGLRRQDTVIPPPGLETRQVRPNTGANPSDSPRGPGLRRQEMEN